MVGRRIHRVLNTLKLEGPDIGIYRELMPEPSKFEDGFNMKVVVGAFFVGLIMLPGSIYLGLMAGASMGPASTWVTVILFTEIARRSFKPLTRQEIYVLLYIAGGMIGGVTMTALGGPFGALIWNQYLTTSNAAEAFGIADQIPNWVSPNKEQLLEIGRRSFLSWMWVPAITLVIFSQIFARMSWFGMGYLLFRLTSDRGDVFQNALDGKQRNERS